MMRKASHLYSHGMTAGGGQAGAKGCSDRSGTANAARNAVSRSWFSQPKPYLGRGKSKSRGGAGGGGVSTTAVHANAESGALADRIKQQALMYEGM